MNTTSGPPSSGSRRRTLLLRSTPAPLEEPEDATARVHGDSYADIGTREDELAGTSSTHGHPIARQPEEPSDAIGDASDPTEGST